MQNQIVEIPPECYSHLKHYLLCSLDVMLWQTYLCSKSRAIFYKSYLKLHKLSTNNGKLTTMM